MEKGAAIEDLERKVSIDSEKNVNLLGYEADFGENDDNDEVKPSENDEKKK